MSGLLHRRPLMAVVAALAVTALGLTGCDSTGSSGTDTGRVEVGFQTTLGSSKAANHAASGAQSADIAGSNGTLSLTDVRLIVSDLELEGEADSAEFEAPPRFLDLPLDTTIIAPVAASEIPQGQYTEFEFEVEDVDLNDLDDDDDRGEFQSLRDSVRQSFPNWPTEASMVAVGSFTPDGGTPQSFTTYFDAEIEVELTLNPPLNVTADGPSRTLTVKLDPGQWFTNADGTVWNLAANDYASTNELVEFEAEFENGISEIERDDDDDDDGDDD